MRRANAATYLRDNGLDPCTFTADALIDALEEYDLSARENAAARASKAEAKGKRKRRNDRGGETATKPIFYGLRRLRSTLGIPLDICDEVKEVAKAGPGMPTVARMLSLDHVKTLEETTCDTGFSKFIRAYAGARWLSVSGTTRTVDLQRTARIHLESTNVLGVRTVVACGVASQSKARSQRRARLRAEPTTGPQARDPHAE